MAVARIDQLKNAKVVDPSKLSQKAKDLIGHLTEDEFHAILTVHAKISDATHRTAVEDAIQNHGF